jgi:hypothetical protein
MSGMFQLVGNRQGRKVVRWGYVLLSCLLLTITSALAAAGIYYIAAHDWNPVILWVGPVVGFTGTLSTLVISLLTPIDRLPLLSWFQE